MPLFNCLFPCTCVSFNLTGCGGTDARTNGVQEVSPFMANGAPENATAEPLSPPPHPASYMDVNFCCSLENSPLESIQPVYQAHVYIAIS